MALALRLLLRLTMRKVPQLAKVLYTLDPYSYVKQKSQPEMEGLTSSLRRRRGC